MGCYLEPKGGSPARREWLVKNATEVGIEELLGWKYEPENHTVPIVLIDNGPFFAAGVLYSERERKRFMQSLLSEIDSGSVRPMSFWIAKIEDVRKVAPDYDDYVTNETRLAGS